MGHGGRQGRLLEARLGVTRRPPDRNAGYDHFLQDTTLCFVKGFPVHPPAGRSLSSARGGGWEVFSPFPSSERVNAFSGEG